jgi:hypothetical protein
MSSEASSSSFSSIGATRGFEGVTTSSATTKSSPASTKIKKVAGIMW